MRKEKTKHRKGGGREKKRKRSQKEGEKNRHLIFLLFVEVKLEILNLTFNTLNSLIKHNNLSC